MIDRIIELMNLPLLICRLFRCGSTRTIEEMVAERSAGMSDAQKAQYWYELSQNIFALLGKVEVSRFKINAGDWFSTAQNQYPTLSDVRFADYSFFTTDIESLQKIMTLDWTNLVPYVSEVGDCDKFAGRLYSHLCDYYKINAAVPVWGDTDSGYHGFNLAVVRQGGALIARLIEPQTDAIFVDVGPLGKYVPRSVVQELGILKIPLGNKA